MKNSSAIKENNNPEEIENVLNFLVDSKNIIISITVFFVLISLFYVFTSKPIYQSFVKMRIGDIDDNNLAMLELKNEVQGLFPHVEIKINDKHRLGPFFSLKSNGESPELSRDQLQEAIDFTINKSKIFINKRISTNQDLLNSLAEKIKLREAQVVNMESSNYPGNFSKYAHILEINFLLNELKLDYEKEFKFYNDPTSYHYTKIAEGVKTTRLEEKHFLVITFGILAGLLTSIPIAYILLILRRFKS